ncbi:MAG: carboxypeptidase-like regulatory domain-containing protein [Candidatus Sericytochromatia bacterium]
MKKKQYLGLATYISIAILSSCTVITNTQNLPSPTPSDSVSTIIDESQSPEVSNSPNIISSNPSTTTTPTPEVSTVPSENTETKATLTGTVYDNKNMSVDDSEVKAESIDSSVKWVGDSQITTDGKYIFRNVPIGTKILITATKSGWTTRTQTQILTSNLTGDINVNKFDFKDKDAIQDEPEVTSIKINDKEVTEPGRILIDKRPNSSDQASISELDGSNLEFELKFSEAIKKDDFQKNLLIKSQEFERDYSKKSPLTTDIEYSLNQMEFDWESDRKSVTIKVNKPLLAQKSGSEAKYSLEIPSIALIDDNGKNAFYYNSSTSQGVIRFESKTTSDNVVFSIKNDDISPTLLAITGKSSTTSNNTVELRFSEPLEVAQFISPTASLNINENGFTEWNGNDYELYLSNNNNNEDVFVLAQVEEDDDTSDITNDFKGVDWNNSSTKIENVKVDGSKVIIELSKNTLISGKKLVASVGRNPKINGVSFSGGTFVQLKDPAGNNIDTGKSTISSKIEVNGSQRVAIIN